MQPSRRPQRVALQVQHEISLMIAREMKDRRVGFVTVTGIQMSPDLRHAKIFVSLMGSESEKDWPRSITQPVGSGMSLAAEFA